MAGSPAPVASRPARTARLFARSSVEALPPEPHGGAGRHVEAKHSAVPEAKVRADLPGFLLPRLVPANEL